MCSRVQSCAGGVQGEAHQAGPRAGTTPHELALADGGLPGSRAREGRAREGRQPGAAELLNRCSAKVHSTPVIPTRGAAVLSGGEHRCCDRRPATPGHSRALLRKVGFAQQSPPAHDITPRRAAPAARVSYRKPMRHRGGGCCYVVIILSMVRKGHFAHECRAPQRVGLGLAGGLAAPQDKMGSATAHAAL